jgi:hypothetical protein
MLESTPGIPLLNPVDPVAGWFGYITPVLNMLESTPGIPLLKVGDPIAGWPYVSGSGYAPAALAALGLPYILPSEPVTVTAGSGVNIPP